MRVFRAVMEKLLFHHHLDEEANLSKPHQCLFCWICPCTYLISNITELTKMVLLNYLKKFSIVKFIAFYLFLFCGPEIQHSFSDTFCLKIQIGIHIYQRRIIVCNKKRKKLGSNNFNNSLFPMQPLTNFLVKFRYSEKATKIWSWN